MSQINRILIIDDSPFDRLIGQKVVFLSGIANFCTVVDSAAAALAYLKEHDGCPDNFPDLIFVDICMPAMDGFDFLKEFEKHAFQKKCLIYILSSSAAPNDIRRAEKCALVSGFIIKPMTVDKAKMFLKQDVIG